MSDEPTGLHPDVKPGPGWAYFDGELVQIMTFEDFSNSSGATEAQRLHDLWKARCKLNYWRDKVNELEALDPLNGVSTA